jgi:hypothetical protein
MRKLILILLMPLILVCAQASRGDNVLTFDDLPPPAPGGPHVPNGYGGLDWSNFYYDSGANVPNSGYNYGIVSPDNVGFFSVDNNQATITLANAGEFTFESAYFTAAWNDGLQVKLQGYNGTTLLDSQIFTVNTSGPALVLCQTLIFG